jgi:hypothetical protein
MSDTAPEGASFIQLIRKQAQKSGTDQTYARRCLELIAEFFSIRCG